MKKLISWLGVGLLTVTATSSAVACGGNYTRIEKHSGNHSSTAVNIDLSTVNTKGFAIQYLVNNGQTTSDITWDQIMNNIYDALMNGTNFSKLYSGVKEDQIRNMTSVRLYYQNHVLTENNLEMMRTLDKDCQLKVKFIPYANLDNISIASKTLEFNVQWRNISDSAVEDFNDLAAQSVNKPIVVPNDSWQNVTTENLITGVEQAFYKLNPDYQKQGYTVVMGTKGIENQITQPNAGAGFTNGVGSLSLELKGALVGANDKTFNFLTEATSQLNQAYNYWTSQDKANSMALDANDTYLKYFVRTIGDLIAYPHDAEFQPLDIIFSNLLSAKGKQDARYQYDKITTKDFMNLMMAPATSNNGGLTGLNLTKLIQDLWTSKVPAPTNKYVSGQNPYQVTDDSKGWENFWTDLNDGLTKGLGLSEGLSYPDDSWKDGDSKYFDMDYKEGIPMPVYDGDTKSSLSLDPIFTTSDISKFISIVVLRSAPSLVNFAHFLHFYYTNKSGQLNNSDILTPLLQYLWSHHPGDSTEQSPAFYEGDGYEKVLHNSTGEISYLDDLLFELLGNSSNKSSDVDNDPNKIVTDSWQYDLGNNKKAQLFGSVDGQNSASNWFWPVKIGQVDLGGFLKNPARFTYISLIKPNAWLAGILDQQIGESITEKDVDITMPEGSLLAKYKFKISPSKLWTPVLKKWILNGIIDKNVQQESDYSMFDDHTTIEFPESTDQNAFMVQYENKSSQWADVKNIEQYNDPNDCTSFRVKLKNLNFTLTYDASLNGGTGKDKANIVLKNTSSDNGLYFNFV